MAFVIEKGRVLSEILEINAVDHCNLSCRSCSHFAPVSAKKTTSLDSLRTDLEKLGRFYHARTVRIIGGEPLLRPDLAEFADVLKESGIADSVRLITNGTLLGRIGPELMELLSSIEISIYPKHAPDPEVLRALHARAKAAGVAVHVKEMNSFHFTHSRVGTSDPALVEQIFRSCKLVHSWGCHTLYDGHFFKCSHGAHLDRQVLRQGGYPSGIALGEGEKFFQRMKDYLSPTRQVAACGNCLGTLGKEFPHAEIERGRWAEAHMAPSEELLRENYAALAAEPLAEPFGSTPGCYRELPLFD